MDIGHVESESTERHKVHYEGDELHPVDLILHCVRKHRAPNGALRQLQALEDVAALLAGQKAPRTPDFARNSLLSTLYQLSEIAEFQRSDFKR